MHWTLGSFLLLLWDYSSLDLAMAHWFGTGDNFALESHWLWRKLLHDDIHRWPWVLEFSLLVGVPAPWGVGGGCFSAGHASAGFAFIGGFFAFRQVLPPTAGRWLVGAMAAGLTFGLAQQVRGAHYMGHTLWNAWLCWTVAASVDAAVSRWIAQSRPRAPAPVPGF